MAKPLPLHVGVKAGPSAAQPKWTAIVLAGERPEGDPLAQECGTDFKALIPIAGRTMLARVTDALLASPSVARIVILAQQPDLLFTGDTAGLGDNPRVALASSQSRIATSIASVAGTDIAPWPVLVTTADHPLLTPSMVETFLAGAAGHDIAFGVGERKTLEKRYPMTQRTWLKFSDGHYSGANLFALANAKSGPALALWSGIEQHRKRGWRIITRFGPVLLLRALTRTIGFAEAVALAGARLGVDVAPVVLPQAEAAIDVDKLSDLELVKTILSNPCRDDWAPLNVRKQTILRME